MSRRKGPWVLGDVEVKRPREGRRVVWVCYPSLRCRCWPGSPCRHWGRGLGCVTRYGVPCSSCRVVPPEGFSSLRSSVWGSWTLVWRVHGVVRLDDVQYVRRVPVSWSDGSWMATVTVRVLVVLTARTVRGEVPDYWRDGPPEIGVISTWWRRCLWVSDLVIPWVSVTTLINTDFFGVFLICWRGWVLVSVS